MPTLMRLTHFSMHEGKNPSYFKVVHNNCKKKGSIKPFFVMVGSVPYIDVEKYRDYMDAIAREKNEAQRLYYEASEHFNDDLTALALYFTPKIGMAYPTVRKILERQAFCSNKSRPKFIKAFKDFLAQKGEPNAKRKS